MVKKFKWMLLPTKKYLCSELKASWLGFYLAWMSYLFRREALGLCWAELLSPCFLFPQQTVWVLKPGLNYQNNSVDEKGHTIITHLHWNKVYFIDETYCVFRSVVQIWDRWWCYYSHTLTDSDCCQSYNPTLNSGQRMCNIWLRTPTQNKLEILP